MWVPVAVWQVRLPYRLDNCLDIRILFCTSPWWFVTCSERVQTSNFLSATVSSCRESNSHRRNGRYTDKTVLSCLAWRCESALTGSTCCRSVQFSLCAVNTPSSDRRGWSKRTNVLTLCRAPSTTCLTNSQNHHCSIYRVGQKTGLFLRVDNFATVTEQEGVWYVKSFRILSRKQIRTKTSVKWNILCVVCINIQCVWNYAEFDNNAWSLSSFSLKQWKITNDN